MDEKGEFWGNQFQRYFRKIKLRDIEKELEAQIIKLQGFGINISHIDGQQNIYFLGTLIVLKLGQKYGIRRIRGHRRYMLLMMFNVGRIKYLILFKTPSKSAISWIC